MKVTTTVEVEKTLLPGDLKKIFLALGIPEKADKIVINGVAGGIHVAGMYFDPNLQYTLKYRESYEVSGT